MAPAPPLELPRPRHRLRVHVALFLLTLLTTSWAGGFHYFGFLSDFGSRQIGNIGLIELFRQGLWYSLTLLAILGAHEMGHYLTCRYHAVDASLPYFLPAPLPLTGTIGAFIRIRQAFPSKAILFDIGVAGPIAGFIVLVPALFLGLSMSHIGRLPQQFSGYSLGEPLLFQWATWLVWGRIPLELSLNPHPMVFAAWFGLFATALNLLPFGQLDGGHIAYAALGRKSTFISLITVGLAVGLTFLSMSWLVVAAMMLLMLFAFGARHPRVIDEYTPLDRPRVIVAIIALIVLVICFTPTPIEPYELLRRP